MHSSLGGSRGIGRAVCIQLANDHDYHLLINYNNNKDAALETLKLVKEANGSAEIIPFNVADAEGMKKALAKWEEVNPDAIVEVIVNNAGITKDGLFMWMKPEDWSDVIDTSLNGFFNVTNHFIQKLLVNKYGRIVNMVSVSGLKGTPGPDQLLRRQRSGYCCNQGPSTRSCQKKRYCKCCCARFYKNRYDQRTGRKGIETNDSCK